MKTLFLDMDGVICDLHPLYREIYGNTDFNQEQFDDAVFTHKIFEIVKPTIEFEDIMKASYYLPTRYHCAILSSLGTSDKNLPRQIEIKRQKQLWLKEHINFDIPAYFVSNKKYKKFFANKYTYLVDDTHINVQEFYDNGGHSILHQHDSLENTLNFIRSI